MAKYVISEETLRSIGDAIRQKEGSNNPILVSVFNERILGLSGGGEASSALDSLLEGTLENLHSEAMSVTAKALSHHHGVVTVNLPKAKGVSVEAFSGMGGLVSANLPSVRFVDMYAFADCRALKQVNIPMVTDLLDGVFIGCSSLETINLPRVNSIGVDTFNFCSNLTTLILRKSDGIVTLTEDCRHSFRETPIDAGTGYIYVPPALLEAYQADLFWQPYFSQFRALTEDSSDATAKLGVAKLGIMILGKE